MRYQTKKPYLIHKSNSNNQDPYRNMLLVLLACCVLISGVQAAGGDPTNSPTSDVISTNTVRPKRKIDLWELLQVGESENGVKPHGKVFSVTPFVGEAYFEASPTKLPGDGELYASIYAQVPVGKPCDKGTLIVASEDVEVEIYVSPFDEYGPLYEFMPGKDFPQTLNGRIGVTRFTIGPDPFDLPMDQNIWFPNNGTDDGLLEICVRAALMVDFTGPGGEPDGILDLVSYVDTNFHVNVNLFAEFKDVGVMIAQSDTMSDK